MYPTTAVRDVYLIVRNGDQVLFLFRSGTGYKDGEWNLPAGKVDGRETYHSAAVRELAEETGITIREADLRAVHVIERSEDGGDPWVGVYFEVTTDATPENREPDKHATLDWFALDALPTPTVGYTAHVLAAIARGEVFSAWSE
jgi:8-oxo-dGTP pyrophosphatase MutT (NUDIX family)